MSNYFYDPEHQPTQPLPQVTVSYARWPPVQGQPAPLPPPFRRAVWLRKYRDAILTGVLLGLLLLVTMGAVWYRQQTDAQAAATARQFQTLYTAFQAAHHLLPQDLAAQEQFANTHDIYSLSAADQVKWDALTNAVTQDYTAEQTAADQYNQLVANPDTGSDRPANLPDVLVPDDQAAGGAHG